VEKIRFGAARKDGGNVTSMFISLDSCHEDFYSMSSGMGWGEGPAEYSSHISSRKKEFF
jgi:hypothetical protein